MTHRPVWLATIGCLMAGVVLSAQSVQGPYARLVYHKVAPGAAHEFETFVRDAWKPIHTAARQAGRLTNWMLFRVHLTGASDEYTHVSASYYDSWGATAPDPAIADDALRERTRALGLIVREALYYRVDFVVRERPLPFKYAVMDFMKVKDGMIDEYLKVEREDWKRLHQVLTDEGNRVGWSLWDYGIPGGVGSAHDFMTAMLFTDYAKIKEANDAEAFRRAHPTGDLAESIARTRRSRDVVRTEIWEAVDWLE